MEAFDPNVAQAWKSASTVVGSVLVKRPLPTKQIQSVGPFVFLDHFGPVPAPREKLPAHPHAGIEVMTYLLDGANEHTDSLGNIGQIGAGGAQWMKAGRGILHTERNLVDRSPIMHGLQIWARLPIAEQDTAPDYRAYQSEEMTEWTEDDVRIRLIAGELSERHGPLTLAMPSIIAHLFLPGASTTTINLPVIEHEYAVYVIAAEDTILTNQAQELTPGDIIRLSNESRSVEFSLTKPAQAEVLLLGGEPAPQPLVFGGSFVLDSEQGIRDANHRFKKGDMGSLDGVPF